MRNGKGLICNGTEKFLMVLGLCIGCTISSLMFIDAFFPVRQPSFLNGLLNLGPKDNTSLIERNSDGTVNKTSILCWIMTTPERNSNAIAVKNTWGKRCDKLIFFSDKIAEELEPVKLNGIREERRFLWRKTREALKYLYDHYRNDFDWFYKADDDTYAIIENLRYVLTPYDPEFPIGLGERAVVQGNKDRSYLGGGAGYVLSRGTLKIYGNVTYHNNSLCPMNQQGGEDVVLGQCLTKSGILLGDTRDELGKHRFHQKSPVDYIQGIWQKWYPNTMIYTYGKGIDSISETAVSFHDLKDESHLYIIEFFIYRLQLFGVEGRFKGPEIAPLPPDVSAIPGEVLMRFLKPKVNESESERERHWTGSPPS
ncbi:glycoprotein-N-acetylgalactosamine 3-beta-galactosyltransferase 1-like [Macrobrachium rosenbergii]|uniref:glycoprotein-N-acetylgalactosamine 3-beta-galactosyltransferase 1-like n=1 Tax=Macrobrachium rosenbergii TaxID=79674 RepID=UPI0034D73FB5